VRRRTLIVVAAVAIVGLGLTLVFLARPKHTVPQSAVATPYAAVAKPHAPSQAIVAYIVGVAQGNMTVYNEMTGEHLAPSVVTKTRQSLFGLSQPVMELPNVLQLAATKQPDSSLLYRPLVQDEHPASFGLSVVMRWNSVSGWTVTSASRRPLAAADLLTLKNAALPKTRFDGTEKPVIYLYPPKPLIANVELDIDGTITASDPSYDESIHGWDVGAYPSGRLTVKGRDYPYLFWEANLRVSHRPDGGFVVAVDALRPFLQQKLAYLGLTPSESADFIAYWLPRMQAHPYCEVTFEGQEYTNVARLSVSPKPDTTIRVMMAWRPLGHLISVPQQNLEPAPSRTGFVVVEWGGTELAGE
jgi:hypothetical protein